MKRLKIGIIGLGSIAQIAHLPVLSLLEDKFEVSALCDISEGLLSSIGERYKNARLYNDALALTKQSDLDAVYILNSDEYHADCAVSALENKKHVFIEKFISPSVTEVERIIKARDENGMQVMVGYMRRYAPAFLTAATEVKKLKRINYVHARDIIGPNDFFIAQTGINVLQFSDLPKTDRAERAERMRRESIGEVSDKLKTVYGLACGLSSHSISAIRELVGIPKSVLFGSAWNNGCFFNGVLEYENFNAVFETGLDNQGRFDSFIEVFGEDKTIKIQYDTSYIRNLPITLTISETNGETYSENTIRTTYRDAYMEEANYFYDVVTKGIKPKTTPEDSIEDLKIFKQLIASMK